MSQEYNPKLSFIEVIELLERLTRLTRSLQFTHGLNPAHWETLRFIARANRYSRTPSALAEFLGTTKGTVSQTIMVLEEKGYICRHRIENDKRVVVLELTSKGQELLVTDPLATLAEASQALDGQLCLSMVEGLSSLVNHIQTAGAKKSFGLCDSCQHRKEDEPITEKPLKPSSYCGVTKEPLSEDEQKLLCVHYKRRYPD